MFGEIDLINDLTEKSLTIGVQSNCYVMYM